MKDVRVVRAQDDNMFHADRGTFRKLNNGDYDKLRRAGKAKAVKVALEPA